MNLCNSALPRKLGLVDLGLHGPEQRAGAAPLIQQSPGLLIKLGFLVSKNRVSQQTPTSQCPLVEQRSLCEDCVCVEKNPKESKVESVLKSSVLKNMTDF